MKDKELIAILDELDLNGADWEGGTDKANGHNYTSTYAKYLAEMRADSINFVEIGVWHGGSMAMWCKYLPKAKFLYYDIANQVKPKADKHIDWTRSRLHIASAYTPESVQVARDYFKNGIDFLLDDGPHTLDSMLQVVSLYTPLMNQGGVLMIEDVQSKDWFVNLSAVAPSNSIFEAIDLSESGRYDDLIAVYKF
jgi:cephalosporin hydroxylase